MVGCGGGVGCELGADRGLGGLGLRGVVVVVRVVLGVVCVVVGCEGELD